MQLIETYRQALQTQKIEPSPTQEMVIEALNRLANQLNHIPRWLRFLKPAPKGLYIYGPVGAGKTYTMDLFYQHLENIPKKRVHYHQFMQEIDAQLRKLQGIQNPIQHIAKDLVKSINILCLDECLVDDVAYAMVFAELIVYLIKNGVVIVITANTPPHDLYLEGLHRERFMPAIRAIQKKCEIMMLDDHTDHRLHRVETRSAYLYPLTQSAEFEKQYLSLARAAPVSGTIQVQNREIVYRAMHNDVIWFDFKEICALGRCQLDYIEIANRFTHVFLSNVPCIPSEDTVSALLLIHFVDVLYDRRIKLSILAAVQIDELYVQGAMRTPFQRTKSRLHEMQSVDYTLSS